MSSSDPAARFRSLPAVHVLLADPLLSEAIAQHGRDQVLDAARRVLDEARAQIRAGHEVSVGAAQVLEALTHATRPHLQRVINATGVVLHTNLGRAPLAAQALAQVQEVGRGYTNLEIRLDTGTRGGRDDGVDAPMRALVGCEKAFAVNNCAAATLLTLAEIARGKEVIVSRGELVEIGGGFRVPEVLAQSGCTLVEVGTTNKTRLADYARAIGPNTGAILKVHRSNFALVGFTAEASIAELSAHAREKGIPVLYDQGSGDLAQVRQAIADGADVVLCSGDKLLGGPQAGIVAGKAVLVERIGRHPLARALRIDKLTLAALEATLALWRSGRTSEVPAARMLTEPAEVVRARAERLAALLGNAVKTAVSPTQAAAGGGTRPGEGIASYSVGVEIERAHGLAALLRTGTPAVLARVGEGRLWLEARTIADEEVPEVAQAMTAALERLGQAGADVGGRALSAEQEAESGDEPAEREAAGVARVFSEGRQAP